MDFDKVSNPQKKWRRSLFIANVVETSQERNISHLSMLESTHRDRVESFGDIRRGKNQNKSSYKIVTHNAILQSALNAGIYSKVSATKLPLSCVNYMYM